MFAWTNLAVLLLSSVLLLYSYVRSVSPAAQEKVIGSHAYKRCFHHRMVAGALMFVIAANYVVYRFFPVETPLPLRFPWPWWISAAIAVLTGVPATILMVIGTLHAGEETLRPRKEHTMYRGIYTRIRHPQAAGEVFLFAVMGLLLHSPFLTLFSLLYFPIFLIMCYAEEQDLLLRYGDPYAEYCRRTGAFWPRRRPKSP